ncbi:AAA family ATPase [Cuniculiplasma sp. SKW3]|uniref:AAA family ATPase n=1 Tax=unclassified Cuniculiplasma TaxID=2619706 RepID=UPI003FD62385
MRVAVTGVPGTGKSTLCNILSREGYRIVDLNQEASRYGCLKDEDVDIDCLREMFAMDGLVIMDAHYSHLIDPFCAIITECKPEILLKRLTERGYSMSKIEENMDVLLSDAIYDEANDLIPSNRIIRVKTDKGINGKDFKRIMDFIKEMERKFNGS